MVALTLALAIAVAGRSTSRLTTFLALYWMTSGLIALRFALALRPGRGARLGLAAGIAAVVGAALLLLRELLSGIIRPEVLIEVMGVAAMLTGLLRVLGGFTSEKRFGHRWTLGGIVLGALEVALGGLLLLTTETDPALLAPITAAWGVASGTLLLGEGLRLRRFGLTQRVGNTAPLDPGQAGNDRSN